MRQSEIRVAKNTFFLYVRMLLVLLINLYTSRVILKTLGFEDYGIYNLVAGLVSLFAFMNSSLSGAASRFIAYSLGDGRNESRSVFSTILTIHSIVAIAIVIICESIGMLFFDRLVIPEGRIFAAKIAFHISVVATAISVLRIPYNASIIAHENMKIFAYVSIVEVLLKLLIVYLLNVILFDKLITYSWLYLTVVLLVSIIYAIYCIRTYPDAAVSPGFDKEKFKTILGFFSWDLYGNLSVAANAQGTNIILNLFGGVITNAACAIANQVRTAVSGFSTNFMLAMNPQIIKSYAAGEMEDMIVLIRKGGLLSFMLLWIFSLPLLIEAEYVLQLWLGDFPNDAVVFTRLSLVFSLIQAMYSSVNIGIHATGKILKLSLIGGSVLIGAVVMSYVSLSFGGPLWLPFMFNVAAVSLNAFINVAILHSNMKQFQVWNYYLHVFVKCIIIAVITSVIPLFIHMTLHTGMFRLLAICLVTAFSVLLTFWFGMLNSADRKMWLSKISRISHE